MDYPIVRNLGLSANVFLTHLIVTNANIIASDTSTSSHDKRFSGLQSTLLPTPKSTILVLLSFGTSLSLYTSLKPCNFILVRFYAFFKGWLLPVLPPNCLRSMTFLPLSDDFKTLALDLVCLPLDYEHYRPQTVCHAKNNSIQSLTKHATFYSARLISALPLLRIHDALLK